MERRSMDERRISLESRLDLLEFRMSQADINFKSMKENHEEMLRILSKLELNQDRHATIIGGAALIATGIVSVIWWVIQGTIGKVFH